jgi:hypothetical protein
MSKEENGSTWPDLVKLIFLKHWALKLLLILLVVAGFIIHEYHPFDSKSPRQPSDAHRELTGVVTDNITHIPIAHLTLFTQTSKTVTNDLGQFILKLDSKAEPGDVIKIYTTNDEYGAAETACTISNDFTFDFSILKDASTKFATGLIKDEKTGEGIVGLEITAELDGDSLQVTPVKTDSFGRFEILLNNQQLRNARDVRLLIRDPRSRYSTPDASLENINSFINIPLQRKIVPTTFAVSGYTETNIILNAGSIVDIEANSNIRLGRILGSSGPEGRVDGPLGVSLEYYCIVPTFNCGSLLYKISGDSTWKVAGKRIRFVADKEGNLIFQINFNGHLDGSYAVDVILQN